jgi:hypothetical protein
MGITRHRLTGLLMYLLPAGLDPLTQPAPYTSLPRGSAGVPQLTARSFLKFAALPWWTTRAALTTLTRSTCTNVTLVGEQGEIRTALREMRFLKILWRWIPDSDPGISGVRTGRR